MADTDEESKGESDKDILDAAQKAFKECVEEEKVERAAMKDDLRFCTLDQWPEDIRKEREGDPNGPRPCLTIDKINQYIVQVVNDERQGKPGINVRPQDDLADPETAKILKGLIRNIEDQSKADIAYATAGESGAKIGLGYFRITTEYVSDDSFDQEIFIRPIPNTFSVYLGKHSMPDGSDAELGFVVESMPIERFKATFPKAKAEPKDFDDIDADIKGDWKTDETITVVEEFIITRTAQELVFLADGTTMSRADYEAWPESEGVRPSEQDSRTTIKKQLKWRKMTAIEVLEKRDLPGKYIPIVEVIGREAWVDGRRVLWGLVRPAKDSLRMYNYWASTITEKMGLAPKTPYIGAVGQFATHGDLWNKANRINVSRLEYDAIEVHGIQVPAPRREGPTPMEAAYFHFMQVIEHDVQTSLGMFKAAVGETESQQSGRAILALQRESDTGTYHFGANLGISIRHGGVIILDLIPHYYDTKRIKRILGEDGEIQTVQLDPEQPEAMREIRGVDGSIRRIYNPSVGKYDISMSVGPSYNTKRMEAQATFVEMSKGAADPGSAAVLRYLTVKNSDFSGADEAAKMLKALVPPQALPQEGQQPVPPQAQAQIMQLTQVAQALKAENDELKSGAREGMAKVQATREAKMAELTLEREVQGAKIQLAREQATADIALERARAVAVLEIERMKISANSDGEVDAAIAKVANLALIHQTKVQAIFDKENASREAAAEGAEKAQAASDSTAQVQALQQQFMSAIQEIVKSLTAKKNISMTLPDGKQASAQVTVQ